MTTIDSALTNRSLLGAALGDIDTWRTWLVVLKAAFGRPLDEAELEVFHAVAGERAPPKRRARELWCVAGRRSGKSRIVWTPLLTGLSPAGMAASLAALVRPCSGPA